MAYTEAQKKATEKYLKTKTDSIRVNIPKGELQKLKSYVATSEYNSLSQFVVIAINALAGCNLLTVPKGTSQHKLKNK